VVTGGHTREDDSAAPAEMHDHRISVAPMMDRNEDSVS